MKTKAIKTRRRRGVRKRKKKMDIEGRIPTMPFMYLRDFTIQHSRRCRQGLIHHANYQACTAPVCPMCQCDELHKHGFYSRKALFINDEGAKKRLLVKARRYRCACCGYLFRAPIEGLAAKHQMSQKMRLYVVKEHGKNVSNKDIAEELHISASTVERIIHQEYQAKEKEALSYPAPLVLGIDEHTIRKGEYATTIADLRHQRIYDIVEGKSFDKVKRSLMAYPDRLKVKVVCMDLSSSFRRVAKLCFPNAKIVSDRFHVIRMILQHFMEFARTVQESIRWQRPVTRALRTKQSKLKEEQKKLLAELFEACPALEAAYQFIQELWELMSIKQQNRNQCKIHIKSFLYMLEELKKGPLELQKIGTTLNRWKEEVVAMWRFTKSNGITEGFHRKMKLIQRRAYGFRNFQNYRLRVLIECGGFRFKERDCRR